MESFCIVFISRIVKPTTSEGLSVLMCDLIIGLQSLNIPIKIYTTQKHYDGLHNILIMNNVNLDKIQIKTLLNTTPQVEQTAAPQIKKNWRRQLINRLPYWMGMLLRLFYWMLGEIFKKLKTKVIQKFPETAHKFHLTKQSLNFIQTATDFEISENQYRQECTEFAKELLTDESIERLFFISAFESDLISKLKNKKIIVTFPDIVTTLFPSLYPLDIFMKTLADCIAKTVQLAHGVICYSRFSRDTQLSRLLNIQSPTTKIEVIPSGFYSQSENKKITTENLNKELNSYVKNFFPEYGPTPQIQFCEIEYILYPTVDRPHKNTRLLLQATQELIRKKYLPIKLILTGEGPIAVTKEYMQSHKLHWDVIFMPELPLDIFNKLLKKATLVVHPSLAEGGDIFNFSRAVSNDCPALLSNIPVAREMFERYGISSDIYREWLFDPFDSDQLADLIQNTLSNRQILLDTQKKVLQKISEYSFTAMAKKYYDFYCSV